MKALSEEKVIPFCWCGNNRWGQLRWGVRPMQRDAGKAAIVSGVLGPCLCPCAEWPPDILKVISAPLCNFRAQLLICCADTVIWVLLWGLLSWKCWGRQLLSPAVILLHAGWEIWHVLAVCVMSGHELSVQGQQKLTMGVLKYQANWWFWSKSQSGPTLMMWPYKWERAE